jgi:hypothetical protein
MQKLIALVALIALTAVPLGAQGRGRGRNGNGVPPGQMPPAGQCRVWYDGRPPGQQPRPMNCDDAERIASRTSDARVIYGNDVRNNQRNELRRERRDERRANRQNRNQNQNWGNRYEGTVPFTNGVRDGRTKGEEDARKNRSFDPVRHDWYRDGDRHYRSEYGPKDGYKDLYRRGFQEGYNQGYRQAQYR